MKRVNLKLNPDLDDHIENWDAVKLEVKLRNGKVHKTDVFDPPGSLENPPTEDMLIKKFMGLAQGPLGQAKAEKAVDTILNVDQLADLGQVMSILTS